MPSVSTNPTARQPDEAKLRAIVFQLDPDKLNVVVDRIVNEAQDRFQNTSHYKELAANGTAVVWTPQSTYKIHIVSLVVSVTAAGLVVIYKRTPGPPPTDEIIFKLVFGGKGNTLLAFGTDLDFDFDQQLVAYYENGGAEFLYISAVGHEHSPNDF